MSESPIVRRGRLLIALRALLAVVLAWAAGLVWFTATAPDHVEDATTHTDAIVVLTGGRERMGTGLYLLAAGRGDRLLVSGVHKGVDVSEILRLAHVNRPDLVDSIVLGYAADDTVGNAAETAAWIADRNVGSIRLVTAAYHMRRALLEFHHAMPDVTIIPHPVFPDSVKSREWWRWPGTATLLATEYSKYLAAIIRHGIFPRPLAPKQVFPP